MIILFIIPVLVLILVGLFLFKKPPGSTAWIKNSIIIILAAFSMVISVCFIGAGIKSGYVDETNQRLLHDTHILTALINQNLSPSELTSMIKSLHPEINIDLGENETSRWNFEDSQKYKYRVRAGGLTFFFDENETLLLVEHWLEKNSPLYSCPSQENELTSTSAGNLVEVQPEAPVF